MDAKEYEACVYWLQRMAEHVESYHQQQRQKYESKPEGTTRLEITKCRILNEFLAWSYKELKKARSAE